MVVKTGFKFHFATTIIAFGGSLPSVEMLALLIIAFLRDCRLGVSQTLFGNPKGPVELGNPNTCAETKLCLNFILFRLKK